MIAERLPGRFTFHDLLRAYGDDLAERSDTEQDRQAAGHRMLDHYLSGARDRGQPAVQPHPSALRPAAPAARCPAC